ncbi:SDR family NAD(P)-dependent oxidoreductase [Chryseobacterium sp. 1B4]
MDTKESYAVVTGASQGLGKSFAEQLAKQKINVILVSLPHQNLKELSRKLEKLYAIKVQYYETDLSVNENVMKLTEWLNQSFAIHILINNAGIDGTQKFTEATSDYINTILQVNVAATSLITHQLLPNLLKQPKAYILNVSSMAAFSPIGFKTVYPASKVLSIPFQEDCMKSLKVLTSL